MIRHNLIVTYRNSIRNKSTFLINLLGLSTGLACVLLIYLWVQSELNVNKFSKDDNRRLQVMENTANSGGITTGPSTPDLLAQALADEMPEVEYAAAATPSSWFGNFTLSNEENKYKAMGEFAGKDFFKVFPYQLLKGDKEHVLSENNSIVISEQLARKIFNTTDNIIGKPIESQLLSFKMPATVSGVFKGIPSNSTERFDFVLSYDLWLNILKKMGSPVNWGNHRPDTYVLLKSGTDFNEFNNKIENFIKRKSKNSNVTLFARQYSDNYLYNRYENGNLVGGKIEYVKLFSIIAIFILLIACINFMNLSTARASIRTKEVGIKKAIGAPRKMLVMQYISESILFAFASLIAAIVLVEIFIPPFNQITGKQLALHFDPNLILTFIGITVLTGLVAGSYPALYLSSFNPVTILKGKVKSLTGEVWMRKGLVIFQFTLSIILIVAVIVVYKQVDYIEAKNLGYNKDNVIYFMKEGNAASDQKAFISELRNIPGIVNASYMSQNIVNVMSYTFDVNWEGKSPGSLTRFAAANVDFGLLETLGIQMKEGRSFSENFGSDSSGIIFNQAAINAMGLKNPLGKTVHVWGKNLHIIGVTQDFNFESLHETVKPFFFKIDPPRTTSVFARIKAGTEKAAIEKLKKFYADFNPGYTFDFHFLDQDYQELYSSEQRVVALSKYFAGMAIIISCLGLFGLAAFAAERRVKEIGIRKVLGASIPRIIYLFSKELIGWILIANLAAWPIAYYFMNNWLDEFAYRTYMEVSFFLMAGGAALLIALLTMGFHAVKAAIANPVDALRYE